MADLSITRAAQDPEVASRVALIAGGEAWTFGALADRVGRARSALIHRGIEPSSRVALIARNAPEAVIAIHALMEIGATIVPVHPRLTEMEAASILEDAAPKVVLREGDLASLGGSATVVEERTVVEAPTDALPLAMVYTSGTTGRAKGAVLSRRAFVASAAASAERLGLGAEDRWLAVMPLCHVGGLSIVTRCLLARCAVILEGKFDPDRALAAITRDGATLLSVVPTMLDALLDRDADNALARLRAVIVGGAAAPPRLLEACARRGVRARTTYGLTEACSMVTLERSGEARGARRGSGEALDGAEIRVVREDGSEAIQGEVGRVLVRGATLMDGYFRGPSRALDAPFDRDGFFDTGDLGERDDRGTLFLHARRTDLVVTGGENVYPVEIEQHLEAMEGVRRALVLGVEDARWGQIVAAVIEADLGLDLDHVARLVEARLAPHKRPRLVAIVDALPLTGSGKVDRSRAAQRYAASLRPLARPRLVP